MGCSRDLRRIVDGYMKRVSGIKEVTERCLRTERWAGSVPLMVVDAAFTSIGLNYFTAVVPRVQEFSREFVEAGKIRSLADLSQADLGELRAVWKNRRSWSMAKEVASCLSGMATGSDREALRAWARDAPAERWEEDPVGRIGGVGLVTFQYLRMMGGIDTVMPDKIVKRVVNAILVEGGEESVENDLDFIKRAEEVAAGCGYRPIELCWMTWLVQPEGKIMRMERYSGILPKI